MVLRLTRLNDDAGETFASMPSPRFNIDLYYDPETKLYYEASSGYFYDPVKSAYYYWSQSEGRYLPADSLIRGQLAEAHSATVALNEASALRRAAEQIAARQAAERVAAQLAEIRAGKDDYAAYAYSTCVAPQHKQLSSGHHNHIQLASASSSSSVASVTSPGARSLLSSGSNTLAHEEAHLPLAYGKAFVAASDIEASLNSWSKPRQASVSNASASVFCPAQYDTEDDIHPPGT
ncbi:unnamed protein product [Protopolystoma xenopodis]|uniref:OCRE domain-containing protein n=1 Tax=Protopolystoma xenopodis TaxID=117903 RepID=A0A3S5FBT3_9PLAT|nr:unnamed protein product [Protopolystoma xenopodis]